VLGGREEDVGLTQEQGLFLGFVADEQDRDVRSDSPWPTWSPFGVGPDEAPTTNSEVEAVAVDLLDVSQCQRQAAHVLSPRHDEPSLAQAVESVEPTRTERAT
jgi:hypothetical protein